MISIGIEIAVRAANRLLCLSKMCLAIPTTPTMRENVPPINKNHIILLRKSRGTLLVAIIVKKVVRKTAPKTVTVP